MKFLALLLLLLVPASSMAVIIGDADIYFVNPKIGYYVVCGYPDGTGTPLDSCYYDGAGGQDGSFYVVVETTGGIPIVGVSKDRVRMSIQVYNAPAGSERSCDGWVFGDADSDANGRIYFTLPDLIFIV